MIEFGQLLCLIALAIGLLSCGAMGFAVAYKVVSEAWRYNKSYR